MNLFGILYFSLAMRLKIRFPLLYTLPCTNNQMCYEDLTWSVINPLNFPDYLCTLGKSRSSWNNKPTMALIVFRSQRPMLVFVLRYLVVFREQATQHDIERKTRNKAVNFHHQSKMPFPCKNMCVTYGGKCVIFRTEVRQCSCNS